jgi:hypothetical protein
MKWNQKTASNELDILIKETESLKQATPLSTEHVRWMIRVRAFLEQVFGQNSTFFNSFAAISWRHSGSFLMHALDDLERRRDELDQRAYVRDLDTAKGLLLAARDQVTREKLEDLYQGKDTGPESSAIVRILNLASRLRKAIRSKPEKEIEIQNAFESLLIGADVEYSREKERIEYSSKTYCPDFTFKRLDAAVEIKLCNREGREQELIALRSTTTFSHTEKDSVTLFSLCMIADLSAILTLSVSHLKNTSR